MTAQHDEARARVVQLDEEIAKVVEQLDHARVRGMKRTGRLERADGASGTPARLKLSMVSRVASEMAAAPRTGVKSDSGWPSRPFRIVITLARCAARSRRASSSNVTLVSLPHIAPSFPSESCPFASAS